MLVNTSQRDAHLLIENTPPTGDTHTYFFHPNGDSLGNAHPNGDTPYTYQPGSIMVYMLLYAFWVNWRSSANRRRTRLAVCPQLDDVLSSVHPRFAGNHKRFASTVLELCVLQMSVPSKDKNWCSIEA